MIFKNWINTVFGTSGALTGDEIPYDGSTSINEKIDANAVTKASQGEVDAGTDDTKFVTPLTLENKPTPSGSDLLTTIDMTNGGANDLNSIALPHQSSWDDYDELLIEVKGMSLLNAGGINGNTGFVAYANGTPSTYLQLVGTSKEAWSIHDGSIDDSETVDFGCTVQARGVTKGWNDVYFNSDTTDRGHGAEGRGLVLDYAGGALSNITTVGSWMGWDTGGDTWSGHTLTLQLETGTTFDGGTLTVKGRNR